MVIKESKTSTQILTDSKPCIEAFRRLSRGQFSTSARVATYFSTLSKHKVTLQHLPGRLNEAADYLSRNPNVCLHDNCQICNFVYEYEPISVNGITIADVENRQCQMPFLSTGAWKLAQQDCPVFGMTFTTLVLLRLCENFPQILTIFFPLMTLKNSKKHIYMLF